MHIFRTLGVRSKNLYYLNLFKDPKSRQAWESLEYWKEHGFRAWIRLLMQPGLSRKLSLRRKFKCEGVVGRVVPGNRQEGWESESGKEGGRAMQGCSCGRPAVQSCTTHPRSHREWTLGLSTWGKRRETHWCTGSMPLDQRLATAQCSGCTGRNPKTTEKSGLEANAWKSRPDGSAINLCHLEALLCPCRTGHCGHKRGS